MRLFLMYGVSTFFVKNKSTRSCLECKSRLERCAGHDCLCTAVAAGSRRLLYPTVSWVEGCSECLPFSSRGDEPVSGFSHRVRNSGFGLRLHLPLLIVEMCLPQLVPEPLPA